MKTVEERKTELDSWVKGQVEQMKHTIIKPEFTLDECVLCEAYISSHVSTLGLGVNDCEERIILNNFLKKLRKAMDSKEN